VAPKDSAASRGRNSLRWGGSPVVASHLLSVGEPSHRWDFPANALPTCPTQQCRGYGATRERRDGLIPVRGQQNPLGDGAARWSNTLPIDRTNEEGQRRHYPRCCEAWRESQVMKCGIKKTRPASCANRERATGAVSNFTGRDGSHVTRWEAHAEPSHSTEHPARGTTLPRLNCVSIHRGIARERSHLLSSTSRRLSCASSLGAWQQDLVGAACWMLGQ